MRMSEKDRAASAQGAGEPSFDKRHDWQLTDIIESIPAGFLMCDASDRVVACNNIYRQWFFPEKPEFVTRGMCFADVLKAFVDSGMSLDFELDRGWLKQRMERRRNPGEPVQHQLRDGRVLRTFEKRTSDGGTITIFTDITALHEQQIAEKNKSEQLRIVLDSIDQGISMMDADLNLVAYNQRFLDLLEFPPEFGQEGKPFADFIRHNAERGEYGEGDIEALVKERVELALQFQSHRFERTRPDGTVIEIAGNPSQNGGFVTTYTEITEHKNAQQALLKRDKDVSEQNRRFNAALDNMSQGLVMYDKNRRLLVCNKRYQQVYKLPEKLVRPGTLYDDIVNLLLERGDYLGVVDAKAYLDERKAMIADKKPVTKIQKFANGRSICILHQPLPDGGWVSTHEDVTDLQRIQAKVVHMAHHDDLTGLPNRTLFQGRLEEACSNLDDKSGFAVLCLDLDRFKTVNDSIGHPMGDKLLKAAAGRLARCVRSGDTIARLGGDEFAILQMSSDQPRAAERLAMRICDVMAQPFELDGHHADISASIGVALAPQNGRRPAQLMKNADMALYGAKHDGRGIYRLFKRRMSTEVRTRRMLETELRVAFERNDFELHYQPLVDLGAETVTGFEALLRWPHSRHGNVSPAEFIPVAEEIGLIIPLGKWILERACLDAARWPKTTRVSVNLSPMQFRADNLVKTVFTALAKSHLRPQQLELEITERVLMQQNCSTLKILHTLRDMGVRIAMDDFGTGYSSLSYLRSFPFDNIKIDRSFIADLSDQPEAAVIVDAVASLSRNLGMTATAEGVETEQQRDHVRAAGFTEMQGFLISPARPAREIDAMFHGESNGSVTREPAKAAGGKIVPGS